MIDFIKRLYVFSRDGFNIGYYVVTDEHMTFHLIHHEEKMKINITVCFHFTESTRYHFELIIDGDSVYEKKVIDEQSMIYASGDIQARVSEYLVNKKGADDGNDNQEAI